MLTGYGDSQGPAASDGAMEGGAGFCGGCCWLCFSDCEVAGPAEAVEAVGKFLDRDKCLKTLNGDLTTLDFCRLLKEEF